MRTAFFGLHVASSGLHTARANLNVTSHNIANAEIPGFSRQVAQMQAGRPLHGTGRGMYGTGSQVTAVIQIRDRFLDRKFWHQNQIHGQFTAVNQHLTFVETVFNQLPNVGVKRTFNGFFSTVQDLTTRAHEPTFRTNVATTAHSLTEQVRQNAFSLQRQQLDLNREFSDVIAQINSLGSQISDLNRQIHIFERDGSNANDLRDQRALLIDELSGLVNVQVDERDFSRPGVSYDRRLTVMINGYDFVDHTRFSHLELVARENPHDPRSGPRRNEMDVAGLYDVFFAQTGSRFDIHSHTLGGLLRGIVDVRDGNGGQITGLVPASGMMLIQPQFDALTRSHATLANFDVRLAAFVGTALPGLITEREGLLGGRDNRAEMQTDLEGLVVLRDTRDGYIADRDIARSNVTANLINRLAALRSDIEAEIGDLTLPANAVIYDRLNDLRDDFLPDAWEYGTFDHVTFSIALTALHGDLAGIPGFPDTILDRITAFSFDVADIYTDYVAPIYHYTTNITAFPANLDADIIALSAAIIRVTEIEAELNTLPTIAQSLLNEFDWALGNVDSMIAVLEARIAAIVGGFEEGDAEHYRDLLTAITPMRNDLSGLIASARVALEDLIDGFEYDAPLTVNGLFDGIMGVLVNYVNPPAPSFTGILYDINAASLLLPPGEMLGTGVTTNFKGIPFYMNQLNTLIRTFARAINEGLNRDGLPIPDAVGHIFGFDANGNNREALFFTFEDPVTGEARVIDNDLRLWIMGYPDGTPRRNEAGDFVTARGPTPPTPPDIVARDGNGNPMFTLDYSQFNALNFILNPELLEDPRLLAASSNQNVGQANNDVIHGFLAVANDVHLFREGRLIDFIIATSNHLAVDNNQAAMFRESYTEITMQTHNHRLSVKSVDTEEEMLNLVRFQNMFIATSRLINVLDAVYDTLINRLGNF